MRYLYALKSGYSKTYVQNRLGEERVVGFQTAGDALGLEAIHGNVHTVGAVALNDIVACRIPVPLFSRIANDVPALPLQLLMLLSRDTAARNTRLLTENMRASRRVAIFLVEILDKLERNGKPRHEITLPMSRVDIGSYLNLAHETVTRSLTRLREAGIIDARKRRLKILEPEQLKSVAAG